MKKLCPECGEAAVAKQIRREGPMLVVEEERLRHAHADGTPLCPVMTAEGYRPALPEEVAE